MDVGTIHIDEVKTHTQAINSTFDKLRKLLDERENRLLDKLNDIATTNNNKTADGNLFSCSVNLFIFSDESIKNKKIKTRTCI